MSKRGGFNAHDAPGKGQFNSFNRQWQNQHNGYQKQQQQRQPGIFLDRPVLSPALNERTNSPLSVGHAGKNYNQNQNHNNRSGGSSQYNFQSSPQHQNAHYSHTGLNIHGMESNPTRSSTPNRGRGGGRGGRGAAGGRGRGNGDRGGRGGGSQGRSEDGRARNDGWNSPAATPPAGNEADEEFEDNVRDLTATPASRVAKFSSNTLEQASYEELKVARDRERRDAIANGTIDDPEKRKTLEHAIDFVGTCMDMCPLFERQQRAVQNAVDRWEINPSTGKIDKALAVKQFHRPAAGNDAQLPSDVRPPRILVSTLDYLINEIAGGSEPLELTHPFLRDRTRGIRQDFTLQNYRGSETVACHELIARFHILAIHKLCEETKNFVPHQEMEQLQKVLTTLSELYEDARLVNIVYPNEPEFRAYQIIAHLRDPDQERQAQRWPDHVFNSKPVQQALRFLTLTQRNNDEAVHMRVGNAESCSNFFGTVFRLVKAKSTSYLMACLLETHFNEIRKTALKAIKNTYRPDTKQLLLRDIVEMLAYENEEMAFRDCEYYGIGLGEVEVDGQMVWHVVIRKGGANWIDGLSALRQTFHAKLVESKIGNKSIPDVIYGRKASSSKGFNPAVAPFLPAQAKFANPSSVPLGSNTFPSSGFGQQNASMAPPSNRTPVFGLPTSGAAPAFGVGFPPTSKPIAGIFAKATSQQAPNVFQKAINASAQASNIFQKAAVPVTQNSVFQSGTPAWGASQQSQDPRLSQASNQNGVFAPGAATSAFPPTASNPSFTLGDGLSATHDTAAKKLPSGIFSAPLNNLPNQTQSSVFKQEPFGSIPQQSPNFIPSNSQSFQAPSKVTSGGFFQPTIPQSGFQSNQTPPTSQSIFPQDPLKPTPNGIFQPSNTSSLPNPSSTTPSFSLFQPPNAQQEAVITSTSGGSVFDSHPEQKNFPSNFFSVPIAPIDYDDYEDDRAYSVPAPIHTTPSGSLFDRIANPPSQQDTVNQLTGTSGALSSFEPPASFTGSSSAKPFSFTASNLVPKSVKQPPPVPVAKLLVPRSAAWEIANSLFDQIVTQEVKKTIQSAVEEDKANIIRELAAEEYEKAQKLVARKIALDISAEQFYTSRSGARVFYAWKARARKLMLKRRGEERRRNPPAAPQVQWRPVQIPDEAFDRSIKEVQRMTSLTYQSVPLKEIFLPKVQQALWPTSEGDRRWRLLCKSSNTSLDVKNYWWIEKFIGNGEPRIAMSKKGTFEVQFDLSDPETEAREIGGFVFGCSADYSISNKERFKRDRTNLHEAVNWLSGTTEFAKLAVMVVCYRSPLDTEDADPYGRDLGRTSGPGRRARIAAIRKALNLDAFDETVIGRDIHLVENLDDCNFTPVMKQFSQLVLETVNPKVAEMMSRKPSPETENSTKRKRARQQQLSVGLPKPIKPASIEVAAPDGRGKRQRMIRNAGMQTNYFSIKARGLHLDWDKFPMPGGGSLRSGVENSVAEEFLVTTTPVTTPGDKIERRPTSPKGDSSFDGLRNDLMDLERMMTAVNGMFDENIEQLGEMKKEMAVTERSSYFPSPGPLVVEAMEYENRQ